MNKVQGSERERGGLHESTYGTAAALRARRGVRLSSDERLCEHEILFI